MVDPHGHLTEDDHSDVVAQFEHARGPEFKNGAPMYIISPNDRVGGDEAEEAGSKNKTPSAWTPTFTHHNPEWVVLSRAAALAKRSHDYLMNALSSNDTVDWSVVFHETPSSFKSYSALLRVDADLLVDKECSSTSSDLSIRSNGDGVLESSYTQSMRQRSLGPKALRHKVYRNLANAEEDDAVLVRFLLLLPIAFVTVMTDTHVILNHCCLVQYDWRPVEEMVQTLRTKFGSLALFFYNDLYPEVIGMLWRPTSFVPHAFSAMHSEFVLPVERDSWKSDSLVIHNTSDVLREMSQYTNDIIVDVKVIDDPTSKARPVARAGKRRAEESDGESSSSDSE